MVIALQETTQWSGHYPNHTYLLDGSNLVAYIRQGTVEPVYFKQPIKGFDRRGRGFVEVTPNPFPQPPDSRRRSVQGSRGQTYWLDPDSRTCSCPGFQFRAQCRHLADL